MSVQGRFTGDYSAVRGGFVYEYTCSRCRRTFLETAPELSEPALCTDCYTGHTKERERRWYRRKRREAELEAE